MKVGKIQILSYSGELPEFFKEGPKLFWTKNYLALVGSGPHQIFLITPTTMGGLPHSKKVKKPCHKVWNFILFFASSLRSTAECEFCWEHLWLNYIKLEDIERDMTQYYRITCVMGNILKNHLRCFFIIPISFLSNFPNQFWT